MDKEDKKIDFWESFKAGFKPMGARAKESVERDREESGRRFELDMKKSREDRIKDFKKGFFSK